LAINLLFWGAVLHFSLTFPSPGTLTRTRPWLIPLVYALPFGAYAVYLGATRALATSTLAWLGQWEPGEVSIGVVYVALAMVYMTVTYRAHADAVTRRKIRWVVFASAVSGVGAVVLWIIPRDVFGHAIISSNLLGLLLLPFPAALAIAILRHRLFDIDVIINRALVYGTLIATLALVYFVGVIALETLFGGMIGRSSPVAIVCSTLASAALFERLRERIRAVIDRRFYRSKYDAARALETFAATLHRELDLAQLSERLVAVVDEALHPTSASLWLRSPDAPPDRPDGRLWTRAAHIISSSPPGSSEPVSGRATYRGMLVTTATAAVASAGEAGALHDTTNKERVSAGQFFRGEAARDGEGPA
jgi:hypothetical protein